MPDEGTGTEGQPGEESVGRSRSHPISLAGAALVLWTARRLDRQERREDRDAPGMVKSDEKSLAVTRRARMLARDGREDASAVRELREQAHGHKRTLQRAEQASRLGGRHLEDARANLAHRLLVAARDDTDVPPARPADRARCQALDDFYAADRPQAEIWAELVLRKPRLDHLLTKARAGGFGPAHQFSSTTSAEQFRDPERRRRQGASARGGLELMDEVKTLLGPLRSNADPIITARRSRDFADTHLIEQRPN